MIAGATIAGAMIAVCHDFCCPIAEEFNNP
jgi:hypothetical protein